MKFLTRKMAIGTNVILMGVLAILFLGMVNYLGARHYQRKDFTKMKIYSLSDQTKAILKELKQPVKLIVFFQPTHPLYVPIRELLNNYQYQGGENIEVEFIDPERDLARAKLLADKYKIDDLNLVIFESGDRNKYIGNQEIADYDYQGFLGGAPRLKAFKGESAFTSAILSVTEARQPVLYFVKGHGEKEIGQYAPEGYSDASKLLQRNNFKIEELVLVRESQIPENSDLVIIAGPTTSLTDQEVKILNQYLSAGGKILIMVDPLANTGLVEFLKQWRVSLGDDIVVDPAKKLPFVSPANLFVSDYGSHPITEKMKGLATMYPLVRSVGILSFSVEGVTVTELAKTTSYGWGEVKVQETQFTFNEGEDRKGPVPIAVAVEKKISDQKSARMVVIGDSEFLINSQVGNLGNKDFFLNIVHWLVQQEKRIAIGPKIPEEVYLNLTRSQMDGILLQTVVGLPALTLIAGGIVLWRRRK